MTRVVTGGLIVLPFVGLLWATAAASTDFKDIPYLQVRINQVLEREPTGAEVEWHNEATGNGGVIRVLKTYFRSPDAPCRDYERTTREPGGQEIVIRGTGCRDASGRWNLKELQETEAPSPESWSPEPPAEGAASPGQPGGQPGGQAGQAGGQSGIQMQTQTQSGGAGQSEGQAGGPSGAQTQTGSQTQTQAGGAGQAGETGQTSTSPSSSVQPGTTESETAAPATSPAASKTAAPSKPASSPLDIELPTPSD